MSRYRPRARFYIKKISSRPDRVAGLRRDMFYLRRFPHPNVVQVFGAFEEKGVLYMVMEHLAHSLRSKSVVRKVDLVRVLADVARALTRLHAAGHVHRDVQARNLPVAVNHVRRAAQRHGAEADDLRRVLRVLVGVPVAVRVLLLLVVVRGGRRGLVVVHGFFCCGLFNGERGERRRGERGLRRRR